MKTLVIFGAEDPEQIAAEKVARAAGCEIAYATVGGKRCHAGNAYQSLFPEGIEDLAAQLDRLILFECGFPNGTSVPPGLCGVEVVKCDHHSPGDSGYDKGPEDFWLGSSLGQLIALLDVEIQCEFIRDPSQALDDGESELETCVVSTRKGRPGAKQDFYGTPCVCRATGTLALTAASDHCPADAYAGRCPGIDPREFKKFRIDQRVDYFANKRFDLLSGMVPTFWYLKTGHPVRAVFDIVSAYYGSHQEYGEDDQTVRLVAPAGVTSLPAICLAMAHGHNGDNWDATFPPAGWGLLLGEVVDDTPYLDEGKVPVLEEVRHALTYAVKTVTDQTEYILRKAPSLDDGRTFDLRGQGVLPELAEVILRTGLVCITDGEFSVPLETWEY